MIRLIHSWTGGKDRQRLVPGLDRAYVPNTIERDLAVARSLGWWFE